MYSFIYHVSVDPSPFLAPLLQPMPGLVDGCVGGSSWATLGRSWAALGHSWAALGRSWAALWQLLDCSLAALGLLFGRSWAALGSSWGALGALLAALGPLLGALQKQASTKTN